MTHFKNSEDNQIQKTISILGCGWLGFPLATFLISKGCTVFGSTTTEAKIDKLELAGIKAFQIQLLEDEIVGDIHSLLDQSEILIIDIPPKLRTSSESFSKKIKNLFPHIVQSGVSRVLFVSSTSVYADDNSVVNENTPAKPETESGKQILEAEQLLSACKDFETTIVRFGGLQGDDRHPIKYLAGRENVDNPDAPINLIQQEDCIDIISKIIDLDCWNQIFCAVSPEHPTREEYYTKAAKSFNLEPPRFSHVKTSIGKIVDSAKISKMLGHVNWKKL